MIEESPLRTRRAGIDTRSSRMRFAPTWLLTFALAACPAAAAAQSQDPLRPARDSITADDILRHTRILASDEFEGRAPGSRGEDLTVHYLQQQFARVGLTPGNPDGTWVQNVPLVGIRSTTEARLTVQGQEVRLAPKTDVVTVSRHIVPSVEVKDSEVVFVGYGVVAPEYGWDDYKGVDVKGKTLIMLVNDPAVPAAGDPAKLDPSIFRGTAMTYYGRWTYKYEIGTEKGAAAVLIVHETGPAGYPWTVVRDSWGGENFDIASADGNRDRVPVEGWITSDKAREIFKRAGHDFDVLKRAAARKDFKPVALPSRASFRVENVTRSVQSRNVIARLEGADPELRDEYVVYTAHWDHFGKDASLEGDQIFNGALDNASGTAVLLELAEAFTKAAERPKRSVLFLAVTAEEQGLLGTRWYAEHPLYPLEKTLANINIDGINQWGRTRDVVVVGLGNSTLDELVTAAARTQDRVIVPDAEPEKGFFYRSDHFELAKQGVPALYTDAGVDFIGKPAGYGMQKREEYTERDYHKPSDEVKPDWDLSGAVADAQLLLDVGYRVAQATTWPEWKPGTEFKAKREQMLKSTR
jgi:Zn-dependent M28 family amino/carboxypeptidase